jgi:hypothetical protein
LCRVPVRDITAMAKAMVEANPAEFLARAKASGVVQDEIQRLQAKEERKRQRRADLQAFRLFKCHAQNGETNDRRVCAGFNRSTDARQAALIAAGAERLFPEKVSGAMTDRKALARASAALGAGDVLLVTRSIG